MAGCLLPKGITSIYKADGVGFRGTRVAYAYPASRYRADPPPWNVGHLSIPAPLRGPWLADSENQGPERAVDWATGPLLPPKSAAPLFDYSSLEDIIFLCVSQDCNPQSSTGKDAVGREPQIVVIVAWQLCPCNSPQAACWARLLLSESGSWVPLVWFLRASVMPPPPAVTSGPPRHRGGAARCT